MLSMTFGNSNEAGCPGVFRARTFPSAATGASLSARLLAADNKACPPVRSERAFTLIEVMIACGIFFMATFAILALVSGTLKNARALQRNDVDCGIIAAQLFETLKTNRQDTGQLSGDFGDTYRDYSWTAEWQPFQTNGLLEVDITLNRRGSVAPVDSLVFLVYNSGVQMGVPVFRP